MYITSISPFNKNSYTNQHKKNTRAQQNPSFGNTKHLLEAGAAALGPIIYATAELVSQSPEREDFKKKIDANIPADKETLKRDFLRLYDKNPVITEKIYNMTNSDGVLMRDTLKDLSLFAFYPESKSSAAPDILELNEETFNVLQQFVDLKDNKSKKNILSGLDMAIDLVWHAQGYNKGLKTILTMKDPKGEKLRFSGEFEHDQYRGADASAFFEKNPEAAKKYADARNKQDKPRFNLRDIYLIGESYGYKMTNDYSYHVTISSVKELDTLLSLRRNDDNFIFSHTPNEYHNYLYKRFPKEFVDYYNERSPVTREYIHKAGEDVPTLEDLFEKKEGKSVSDFLENLTRDDGSPLYKDHKPDKNAYYLCLRYPDAFEKYYNEKNQSGEYIHSVSDILPKEDVLEKMQMEIVFKN